MRYERNKEYRRIIESRQWREARRQQLQRCPLCVKCKERGRYTLATDVHHITPILTGTNSQQMKALAFSTNNMLSLCRDCHHLIHDEMLKSKSKQTKKERDNEQLDAFRQKFGII